MLFHLKQYPPEPTPAVILSYLDRTETVRSIGVAQVDFTDLGDDAIGYLAELVRRYDVDDLKRFAPLKRYALVTCFLVDAQKTRSIISSR